MSYAQVAVKLVTGIMPKKEILNQESAIIPIVELNLEPWVG
jgi:hypothetical protein